MDFGVIYLITNLLNGKYYVGMTRILPVTRWAQHKCEARRRPALYLHKAIAKYGERNFSFDVIGSADSDGSLATLETLWIVALGSSNLAHGYNLTLGGEGVVPNTETRKLQSEAAKRRGMAHLKGKQGWAKGKKFSAEHRANLSKTNKGKRPSVQCLLAVSAANRTRVPSEATRAKLRAAAYKANSIRWGYVSNN